MKKALCTALAVLMAITLIPGCGKDSGASGEKATLLIGLPGGDGVTAYKVVENFIAEYSDKYNIKTDEAAWSDFTKKLKLQFVSKNDITPVFFTDSMQAMDFGMQGVVVDLKSWADSELDAEKYSGALFALTDNEGHLWGVPHAMNSIAMIINKDILAERGLSFPSEDWTWQDMLDMAEKLTFDRDGDGEIDVYGMHYIGNITQGWLPFMAAVGTTPYKNGFRDSNLDDPLVKEAIHKFAEPIQAGHLMPPADLSQYGTFEAAFAEGKIAMGLVQSSSLATINKFNPDLNYDAQIMPIGWNGERKCIYVPNTWQVSNSISDAEKAAALDWLKFYLSEESQMIVAAEGPSGFPVLKAALQSISEAGRKPESIDAFYRGIDDYGMTLLENPSIAVASSVINNITGLIKATPDMTDEEIDQTIADGHTKLQAELDYFYENQ